MENIIEHELLAEIEAFLDRTGMSRSAFGRGAINDPSLIPDLESNRELRTRNRERVLQFMAQCDVRAAE